jgi:hypothetical protein
MSRKRETHDMHDDMDDMHDDMMDDAEETRQRRRDTIMRQRLRAARGEPDERDERDERASYAYRQQQQQRARPMPSMSPAPAAGGGGMGCAQSVLYMVLGGLVALVILLFFSGQALSNVGNLFGGLGGSFLPGIAPSPTPTIISRAAVIQQMQQLQRLQTTSYTIEQIIEARVTGDALDELLFGDRLLLIAHGQVEAGIDLDQLSEESLTVSDDGRSLTMYLPPVQIFSVTIDNEKTRVYDREKGLLASQNKDLETDARRFAENEILQAACESDIMGRASEDSQLAMQQFLTLLDFEEVQVIPAPVPECVVSGPPGTPPGP